MEKKHEIIESEHVLLQNAFPQDMERRPKPRGSSVVKELEELFRSGRKESRHPRLRGRGPSGVILTSREATKFSRVVRPSFTAMSSSSTGSQSRGRGQPMPVFLKQMPFGWREHVFHTGTSSNYKSIFQNGLWAGGLNLRSTRQACFFQKGQEMSSRQRTID